MAETGRGQPDDGARAGRERRAMDAYDLAPAPAPPRLPGTVIVRETADALIDAVAADLAMHALNCVRTFGDFHLALSGGQTPAPLYMRLMYDPAYRDLPWKRTHLWIVDERRVHFDDDRSNFKLIRETIVDHSDIPRAQAHPIFPLANDAAERYEAELRETLAWREKGHDRLDYVLLGMDARGGTAGLLPGSPAVGVRSSLVTLAQSPGADRVTMTLPMINGARFVAVLVTGEAKRDAVARLASGRALTADAPIAGVAPLGGELRWYLDRAACPE